MPWKALGRRLCGNIGKLSSLETLTVGYLSPFVKPTNPFAVWHNFNVARLFPGIGTDIVALQFDAALESPTDRSEAMLTGRGLAWLVHRSAKLRALRIMDIPSFDIPAIVRQCANIRLLAIVYSHSLTSSLISQRNWTPASLGIVDAAVAAAVVGNAQRRNEDEDEGLDALQGLQYEHAIMNYFRLISFDTLAEIAQSCPYLEFLELNNVSGLTINLALTLSQKCPRIRSFINNQTSIETPPEPLVNLVTHLPQLVSLEISHSGSLTDAVLSTIIRRCRNIHELRVPGCTAILDVMFVASPASSPTRHDAPGFDEYTAENDAQFGVVDDSIVDYRRGSMSRGPESATSERTMSPQLLMLPAPVQVPDVSPAKLMAHRQRICRWHFRSSYTSTCRARTYPTHRLRFFSTVISTSDT